MDRIQIAVHNGVSFICANCDKYWWGQARGLDTCKAGFEGKECSGIGKFKDFPEYEGVLKGHFHQYCFVCGKKPDFLIEIPIGNGLVRNFGVCEKDRHILFDFRLSEHMPNNRPRHQVRKKGSL